ncbi:transcription factor TRY [Populus alba]|uniref:transcription factor TRY n=1 Tax=Populus alba TaxID=43335 RepID=UPI00158D1B9F|nr:transcription factor CPC-like [Populus alba]XP_034908395.1 transcription factor CPC-like [Populus alba]XP_034908396.1 transcription factor CPC-like [Populus alba]XP_034908397.1 transcription factor CPC-like [Populus alba]
MPKSQQTYIFFVGWVAFVLLLQHKFGLLDLRLLQNSTCINSFPSTLANYYLSLFSCPAFSASFFMESMDRRRRRRKQAKINNSESEEVSSIEWEFINMSEQEEDLIHRMYRLVGERWDLIAGRIPGRKAEEIERFWIMKHREGFAEKRRLHGKAKSKTYR